MSVTFWAILLRPFVYFALFVCAVAPLMWVLYKIIPDGKLKVFLFKFRSGATATTRDKVVMWVGVVLGYALIAIVIGLLISRGGGMN